MRAARRRITLQLDEEDVDRLMDAAAAHGYPNVTTLLRDAMNRLFVDLRRERDIDSEQIRLIRQALDEARPCNSFKQAFDRRGVAA